MNDLNIKVEKNEMIDMNCIKGNSFFAS